MIATIIRFIIDLKSELYRIDKSLIEINGRSIFEAYSLFYGKILPMQSNHYFFSMVH